MVKYILISSSFFLGKCLNSRSLVPSLRLSYYDFPSNVLPTIICVSDQDLTSLSPSWVSFVFCLKMILYLSINFSLLRPCFYEVTKYFQSLCFMILSCYLILIHYSFPLYTCHVEFINGLPKSLTMSCWAPQSNTSPLSQPPQCPKKLETETGLGQQKNGL